MNKEKQKQTQNRSQKSDFRCPTSDIRGITLIALIITIIIMLILVGISIQMLIQSGLFESAKIATTKTDEAYRNEANLGNKVTINGKEYNTVEEYVAELNGNGGSKIVSDGSFDGKINTPKLTADMTPIAWDESGEPFIPETNEEWYNYANNKWANAVTEDGSYWVWIPRYEYKITAPANGASAGTIDVRFISTTTKQGSTGYTTENGITTSSDNYIIHPAFTNNVDVGGWDSELAGFWVAKYEMSMEGKTEEGEWTTLVPTAETSTTAISGNVGTTNTISTATVTDETNTYTKIRAVSKPNVSSWRYINISNCYENAYNYDRNKESHLMKNSEWGAVAYLTHSSYGRDGEEVSINSKSTFISAAGGEATSSTGNKTGIYDLSGAAYEYVAAYNDAYSSTGTYYSTTNASYCSSTGKNMGATGFANGGSTKYLTAYKNSTSYNYVGENASYSTFEAFESAGEKVSILGDGIKEVWTSGNKSWYSDFAYFVYSSVPFFGRGGSYTFGESAGVFYSCFYNGTAYSYNSFRVVCPL